MRVWYIPLSLAVIGICIWVLGFWPTMVLLIVVAGGFYFGARQAIFRTIR